MLSTYEFASFEPSFNVPFKIVSAIRFPIADGEFPDVLVTLVSYPRELIRASKITCDAVGSVAIEYLSESIRYAA